MSSPTPLRIYADFNGLVAGPKNPQRWAVVLDTFGSMRDLSDAGVVLEAGLPLIAYDWDDDDQDLEGHGTAEYDAKRQRWVVEFDEIGLRRVPAVHRTSIHEYRCVSCRRPLPTKPPVDLCPHCGTNAATVIAPPR